MKNQKLILFGMLILFGISLISASSITRTVPSTASGNFQITYTAGGVSGNWGASVQETITGGCKIDGKTNLNFVMLSDLPNPLTYTVTAPTSSAACTFTGDYKFGIESIIQIPSSSISITGSCNPSCSNKQCGDNGCGGSCGICSTNKECINGQCVIGTCPTGQTKCSDGTCKTSCETPAGFCWQGGSDFIKSFTGNENCQTNTIILIIIGVIAFVILISIMK